MKKIFNYLKFYICKLFRIKGHGISLIVPLHLDPFSGTRLENWIWLKKYWEHALPGAEIIIGTDPDAGEQSFSKSVAINNAVAKSHGDILVIADGDVYISVESILHCANEIRLAEKRGNPLWFMPYRRLFRLTQDASRRVLDSDPKNPYTFPSPPESKDYSNKTMFQDLPASHVGHWYGAMIQIMSRKAFYTVGGWDPRMRGWGGEDHAAMVAMDTLYGPHKTLPSQVLHLWHPTIQADGPGGKKRLWDKQTGNNDKLSWRYYYSQGNRERMRKLVDEFIDLIEVLECEQPPVPPNTPTYNDPSF